LSASGRPSLAVVLLLAPLACLGCDAGPSGARTAAAATAPPKVLGPSAAASDDGIAPPLATASATSLAVDSASARASASAAAPDADPPPCPPDMVLVARTCVDKYEASLLEVGADGATSPHPYFARLDKGVRYRAVNAAGAFPQGYISRVESDAACKDAGKRLCSMREWKRACEGKGFMTYPYGQRGVRGKCNTGKVHLLTQMFGKPAGGFKYEEHFNSPDLNKTPDFLAESGRFAECQSDLGVFDMVGNLHEWVKDTVDDDFVQKMEDEDIERRKQPWRVGNGVFMGGFYSTTSEHGPGCTFTTIAHEPTYHDYSTGFRCCKDAVLPKKTAPVTTKVTPAKKPTAPTAPAAPASAAPATAPAQ
jgi:hypothetical protein